MASTVTAARDLATAAEFRVHDARYVRSGPDLASLGPALGPEVAFVGRSNVGKSSLLNELLSRRSLVRVSRTPGRTRLVNLFAVKVARVEGGAEQMKDFIFADLPGYGFAQASKADMAELSQVLSTYLNGREALKAACQLLDVRHAPSVQDHEVFNELGGLTVERILVATKGDKIVRSKQKAAVAALAKPLGVGNHAVTLFSATDHVGRAALWQRIWDVLP